MTKPTARELLASIVIREGRLATFDWFRAEELASRVEKVLAFCTPEAGPPSAGWAKEILRLLNGEEP
ncbi:MAG: hypothetical protein A2Y61_05340 [Chloroflexi bacterium RBG_13_60_13]|nr:MAG: hypothetical protein A2Y61_05340 [Chloroflexi bacterium RBG_13_60_13]